MNLMKPTDQVPQVYDLGLIEAMMAFEQNIYNLSFCQLRVVPQ